MNDRDDFLFRMVLVLSTIVIILFILVLFSGCCSSSTIEISKEVCNG